MAVAFPNGNEINYITSRQAQIQESTYFRVMRILQENPDLAQRNMSVGGSTVTSKP
jgi:hypothetical protein